LAVRSAIWLCSASISSCRLDISADSGSTASSSTLIWSIRSWIGASVSFS
jgi:hypothetical protein